MFLGMLRVTTILLFGAACLIVAPSSYMSDNSWYIVPLGMSGNWHFQVYELYIDCSYSDCRRRSAYDLCRVHISTLCEFCPSDYSSLCSEISGGCLAVCKGTTTYRYSPPHHHEIQHHSPANCCACRRPCG